MKSSLICSVINRAWIESMRLGYMNFQRALNNTESTQERYLGDLLKKNSTTEFGKRYDFRSIRSIKQFQKKIPLSTYSNYEPYIDMIAQGHNNILTAEAVRIFEPSSGSTSASKLIPYTRSLKQEFNRGIAPWMCSLYRANPELFNGKAYWSISPAMNKEQYKGRVKVGFEDDSDYLGFWGKHFYNKITAVPTAIAKETDINTLRNNTLAHLLLSRNLTLMSVWNPTFLTLLLEHLLQNKKSIFEIFKRLCGDKQSDRTDEIENLLVGIPGSNIFQDIWPNLVIISCWTDGASQFYVDQLGNYFPDVKIQGKGLIATEAFVSLPFSDSYDPVLAVTSHFFEFIDETTGHIYLAHELSIGKTYSVVISTGGGFYRYQLEDIVEVTGFLNSAPTFRFITKSNHISDYSGEKLNEKHVKDCFENIFKKYNLQPEFFLLAPIKNGNNDIRYCVFVQDSNLSPERASPFVADFEEMLCDNFYYDYCRKLGQLKDLRLFAIKSDGNDIYLKKKMNDSIKAGDVKAQYLSKDCGWDNYFEGSFYD